MKDTTMTAPTPSMILIRLHGPLAAAVAVEWTNAANPASGQAEGPGWEPCHRVGTGLWRLDRLDPEAAARLLTSARLENVAIRYRLEPAGFWSPASEDRKEISLVGGPALLAAPALVGSGIVGAPVAVDPGQWSGAPAIALAWCRDGAAIEGATGAEYLPGDADDRTTLTCRVRATNAADFAEAVTAGLAITQAPPQVVGTLFDEVFDEGSGPQEVATAEAFAGRALVFAVEGAGAAVDPATGVVTIPTDASLAGEVVTVSAANSGGTATVGFQVTVEALPEVAPPPLDGAFVVGQDATNRGFHVSRDLGAFGGSIDGIKPLFFVSISNGFFLIGLEGAAKVFGADSLRVTIGAFDPFTVNWDAGNGRYAAQVPWLWAAMANLVETTIPYSVETNVVADPPPPDPTPAPGLTPTTMRTSITFESGCTVTFNKAMPCGQYWDGSWFVHNPSGSGGFAITGWTPNSTTRSNGTRRNGLVRNPERLDNGWDSWQTDGSSSHMSFTDSLDRCPSRRGNMTFSAGQEGSVLKAIGVDTNYARTVSWRPWYGPIDKLHCLTVVSAIPPAGSFRPSANANVTSKASLASINDVVLSRVPVLSLPRLPSQDYNFLTLSNCLDTIRGRGNTSNGNYHNFHALSHIRAQSMMPRRAVWGSGVAYPAVLTQQLNACMYYAMRSGTSEVDRKTLIYGMVQMGLELHQTAAALPGSVGGSIFHATPMRMLAQFAAGLMSNSSLRNTIISVAKNGAKSEVLSDQYRYISNVELAGGSGQICPIEGRDPRTRRQNASASWPWDFPFIDGHVGMPQNLTFKTASSSDHGARVDSNKSGMYHVENFFGFYVQLATSNFAALEPIEIDTIDRFMYKWAGHYAGHWDMPANSNATEEWIGFVSDWRIYQHAMDIYNASRSQITRPVWKGQPEQPWPPKLSKTGTTITVEVLRTRIGNGFPILEGQYRVRQSSNRNMNTGGSWTTGSFTVPPAGQKGTFTITGRPTGANQVQIRYRNAAGWGPWSLNLPYRADEAATAGHPAGNMAQITI
jgi:hypothetical protein